MEAATRSSKSSNLAAKTFAAAPKYLETERKLEDPLLRETQSSTRELRKLRGIRPLTGPRLLVPTEPLLFELWKSYLLAP